MVSLVLARSFVVEKCRWWEGTRTTCKLAIGDGRSGAREKKQKGCCLFLSCLRAACVCVALLELQLLQQDAVRGREERAEE